MIVFFSVRHNLDILVIKPFFLWRTLPSPLAGLSPRMALQNTSRIHLFIPPHTLAFSTILASPPSYDFAIYDGLLLGCDWPFHGSFNFL